MHLRAPRALYCCQTASKRVANHILAWLQQVHARLQGHEPNAFINRHAGNAKAMRQALLDGVADMAREGKIHIGPDDAPLIKRMVAWHGTPHDFDTFSLQEIGSGEGAQAYGWGLYFAGLREVAEHYRDGLSRSEFFADGRRLKGTDEMAALLLHDTGMDATEAKDAVPLLVDEAEQGAVLSAIDRLAQSHIRERKGHLYKVNIAPKNEEFLDWDKPLSSQPENIRRKLETKDLSSLFGLSGRHFYTWVTDETGPARAASKYLNDLGIPGVKYLDGFSRDGAGGTHNYVFFDDSLVKVEAKYARRGQSETDAAKRRALDTRQSEIIRSLGSQKIDRAGENVGALAKAIVREMRVAD